jgi:GT2 family glycosyltransferase
MKPIIIAIPSRFDAHLHPLIASIREKAPYKVVPLDDGLTNPPRGSIKCPRPFIYSRNINLAFKKYYGHDFVLLNDDTIMETQNPFSTLRDIANEHSIDILSPKIKGHARNPWQTTARRLPDEPHKTKYMVAFVAVFLSRRALERVGLMDERFRYYGWDDDDYCLRARLAGLKIGITRRVVVRHNHGSGSSFKKLNKGSYGPGNVQIFRRKWGYTGADFAIDRIHLLRNRRIQIHIPVK